MAGEAVIRVGRAAGMAGLAAPVGTAVAGGEGVGKGYRFPGAGVVTLRALALEMPGRAQRFVAGGAVGGVGRSVVAVDVAPRAAGVGVAYRALAGVVVGGAPAGMARGTVQAQPA